MILIRVFEKKDAEIVSHLIRKTLNEINSKFYPQSVIQFMSNEYSPQFLIKISQERDFLVAILDDKIVGSATLFNDYIGTVFVHPEYQGKGIGTSLMQHIERLAKRKKINTLQLEASINSVNFYTKLGYIRGKTNYHENYGCTYEMKKNVIINKM
jgi:GNAT superfamily N-acetyltransferase